MRSAPVLSLLAIGLIGVAVMLIRPLAASEDHEQVWKLKERGEILPLEVLIERVHRDHPGHLIEAELEREGDRYVYELEFVDETGKILEFYYDAQTGELIKSERQD